MSTARIVVGVDGSELANAALRWASDRARERGASLEVIHAWLQPDFGGYAVSPATLTALEAGAHEIVEQALASVALKGIEVEGRVVAGPAPATLLEAAKGADMLVIGARGHGGFSGLVLGSTCDQCLHHATTPLAIVREHAPTTHDPHIVVAFDGSENSARALAWGLDEARRTHASLTAVNAWDFVPDGVLPTPTTAASRAELEHASSEVLASAIEASDTSGVPTVGLKSVYGNPTTVILRAAKDADLIVMGSRGRGGFVSLLLGSVSTQVVHHAQTTVVVLPPAER